MSIGGVNEERMAQVDITGASGGVRNGSFVPLRREHDLLRRNTVFTGRSQHRR
jgi:hypothetical protein